MSYEHPNCQHCRDTGRSLLSNGKHSSDLDCGRCGAAQERSELEAHANNLVAINRLLPVSSSLLWAIHQRAKAQGRAAALAELHPNWLAEQERANQAAAQLAGLQAQNAALLATNRLLHEKIKTQDIDSVNDLVQSFARDRNRMEMEVADLKAQLAASIAASAQQRWISVTDQLPEHGQSVAFVIDSEDWPRLKYLHGRVLGGQYDEPTGHFMAPGFGYIASLWMPLPTPPSAAQQEN